MIKLGKGIQCNVIVCRPPTISADRLLIRRQSLDGVLEISLNAVVKHTGTAAKNGFPIFEDIPSNVYARSNVHGRIGTEYSLRNLALRKRKEAVWLVEIWFTLCISVVGADIAIITGGIKHGSEPGGVCVVREKRQPRTEFQCYIRSYFPAILGVRLEIPKLEMGGRHICTLEDAVNPSRIKIREGVTRSPGLAGRKFDSALDLAVQVLHFGGPLDQSSKFYRVILVDLGQGFIHRIGVVNSK